MGQAGSDGEDVEGYRDDDAVGRSYNEQVRGAMTRNAAIFWEAFFDGVSRVGLFGRLRRPGAPTCLVDTRSVAELKASGEFDEMLAAARRYDAKAPSPSKPASGVHVQHASK